MIGFLFRLILFFGFLSFSIFYAFTNSETDLTESDYLSLTNLNEKMYISSLGQDKKNGNVVGIQTYTVPIDYSNPERFTKKIESYLIIAKQNGFLKERTIVIFPEHIGTPLFLLEEKKQIYTSKNWSDIQNYFKTSLMIQKGTLEVDIENPIELIKSSLESKSSRMRDVYYKTFSSLAKKYEVVILAGSILLPNPIIKDNKLIISKGQFSSISIMFDKKGNIFSYYEKNNLFDSEKLFSINSNFPPGSYSMPGFNNKVVAMFSRDSLENKYYTKQVYNTDLWIVMSQKFKIDTVDWQDVGISGDPRFDNKPLFQESEKLLSNKLLWSKYGVSGKFQVFPTKQYMEVFFKGDFYDIDFDGNSSFGVKQIRQETVESEFHSAILNIFL